MKPRVYIAGPMTGLPESNYPAFNAAAAAWRAKGWDVENPAEHFGGAQDRTYEEYVEVDIAALKTCDAVAMLPGWNVGHSGAVWERAIARHLLHIPVLDATSPCRADDFEYGDGEIYPVSYDEYRAFKRWQQLQDATITQPVAAFVNAVVPLVPQQGTLLTLEPDNAVPVSRHPDTGALGRWIL